MIQMIIALVQNDQGWVVIIVYDWLYNHIHI